VLDGFRARLHSAARAVARAALERRALKDAADVAALALDRQVSAVEREARREVVERRPGVRLCERRAWHEQGEGEQLARDESE
jgi:hypothetical protein